MKNYKFTLIGIIVGAIAGYLYYYYIGCSSGSCSITSKPHISTLYGSLMFGIVGNMFEKKKKEK